jgi:hypothetical protein
LRRGEASPEFDAPAAGLHGFGVQPKQKQARMVPKGYPNETSSWYPNPASLRPPLNHGEALFVLHLMTFKWEEALPYPS